MRKSGILALVFILIAALLCGCSSAVPKELEYDAAYPLGAAEYQMAVNHKLAPLITCLQPLANAETISEEKAVETLQRIDEVYGDISLLNPPQDKNAYQANLLSELSLAAEHMKYFAGQSDSSPSKPLSEVLSALEDLFRVSVN